MDLIGTVRQRYDRNTVAVRRFTLVHRQRVSTRKEEPLKKGGLLDLFRPQLSAISKKIHDDVAAIFGRWSQTKEKTLTVEIGKSAARQESAWKEFALRTEKMQREYARATDKRFDLVLADTGKKLAALRRDADLSARREAEKKRKLEATPREDLPVSARYAQRMIEGSLEQSNSRLETEISRSARKSVREAVRRVREEDEYERMRNAGRRRT